MPKLPRVQEAQAYIKVLATHTQYNGNRGGLGKKIVMPRAQPTLPNQLAISNTQRNGYCR